MSCALSRRNNQESAIKNCSRKRPFSNFYTVGTAIEYQCDYWTKMRLFSIIELFAEYPSMNNTRRGYMSILYKIKINQNQYISIYIISNCKHLLGLSARPLAWYNPRYNQVNYHPNHVNNQRSQWNIIPPLPSGTRNVSIPSAPRSQKLPQKSIYPTHSKSIAYYTNLQLPIIRHQTSPLKCIRQPAKTAPESRIIYNIHGPHNKSTVHHQAPI